ncbi:LOW QUALITY PROTEIN: Reverse transcriptase [Phytophthora palmivora]|uniref:Reverse transcriptase n=1 Tax=Phytophthora palmivora TaxID=4796 RepID=A0A2P4XUG9_9STRA|nr:LOW QUALITY PROTEIN: Reverse transcriptase [Phytophthora palmivora]
MPDRVVRPRKTRWDVARRRGEDVKLECSPGWNLVRAERSKLCIYAVEVPIYPSMPDRQKLWITRGERWDINNGQGSRSAEIFADNQLVRPTSNSFRRHVDRNLVVMRSHTTTSRFCLHRFATNLAFEATTDRQEDLGTPGRREQMSERPQYDHPPRILTRQTNHPKVATMQTAEPKGDPEVSPSEAGIKIEKRRDTDKITYEDPGSPEPIQTEMQPENRDSRQANAKKELHEADQVCIHEGGDFFAEDVEMNTPEEIDRLRQIIWKRAHLLIGKGNALPPAALGAICDIDLGEETPVAERCRRVTPPFREKLSDIIKGLLSATIITHSTSPWASPIMIIIKKNGVDIRLVNSLPKLMVYPMLLINDFLEDLDKMLWYCSLDTLHRGLRNLGSCPLREDDFHKMRRAKKVNSADQRARDDPTKASEDDRWTKAKIAFTKLKAKIVTTLTLRHFDPSLTPVVVVYSNKWAISAALMQRSPGSPSDLGRMILPTGHAADQSIVTIFHTGLALEFIGIRRTSGEVGRAVVRADARDHEIIRGEEEILGAIAASITPRAEVDDALVAIAPRKQPRKNLSTPPPTIEPEETQLVASFDGSAQERRSIQCNHLEAPLLEAMSDYSEALTANEAEYRGFLLGFDLLSARDRGRVVISGDSNLMIRQMRDEIDCKALGLQLLRQKALDRLDWNQSADRLASAALQRQEGEIVTAEEDRKDLMTLNRLDELLRPEPPEVVVHVSRIRCERIRTAQDEEKRIAYLTAYMQGDVKNLTADEAKACSKIASTKATFCSFALDVLAGMTIGMETSSWLSQNGSKFFYTIITPVSKEGIKASEERTRGLDRVSTGEAYIEVCKDKWGDVRSARLARDNLLYRGTNPFQVISMDHIPSLPRSFKGNTKLLIWADVFSGYVIAKASSSREAQTKVENYEECVFRRFGASDVIRHDREPGFMSDFFRAINRILKTRQSATMAYRPQANGKAERTVQTLTRALKLYVADVNQQDWDDYAERLTFALNTRHDAGALHSIWCTAGTRDQRWKL